jgi:hypothetical protein
VTRPARAAAPLAAAAALLLLPLALGAGSARADSLDEAWRRGNDAYLRSDYAGAVTAYEQLDRQGVVSPELAYHLGNAYYRRGDVGRAVWCYERALSLDPGHEDARYNLDQARKLAARRVHDKIEGIDRDPLWMRAVTQLGGSTTTWLFLALYLCTFVALGLRVRARRAAADATTDEAPAWGAVAAVLAVAAALAGLLLAGRAHLDRVPFAVVLPDAVPVKDGADPNYRTSFQIHAGLKVRLLDSDGGWARIRLANGLEGWVRAETVGRL